MAEKKSRSTHHTSRERERRGGHSYVSQIHVIFIDLSCEPKSSGKKTRSNRDRQTKRRRSGTEQPWRERRVGLSRELSRLCSKSALLTRRTRFFNSQSSLISVCLSLSHSLTFCIKWRINEVFSISHLASFGIRGDRIW